jgi:hypothetical protein
VMFKMEWVQHSARYGNNLIAASEIYSNNLHEKE